MVFRMNYTKLTNNLIDLVKEEQTKLGYRKEAIRLYYPLSSLQHILGTTDSAEHLIEKLQKEANFAKDSLGTLDISCQNERFCIGIPVDGSEWVHDHMQPAEFIVSLVDLVSRHGCTMEDIFALFRAQEQPVEIKQIKGGEFDYRIRFLEGDDPYYYCFKDEEIHIIYHRFLPEDYEDFNF